MTKIIQKSKGPLPGIFLPGVGLMDILEHGGGVRGVFDRVHTHFFETLCAPDSFHEGPFPARSQRTKGKGGSHAQGHSR
ncbi:MAG: hypothetical protein JNK54_01995 [Elusimicrobia bacterium]|jgi:hypothetical protein|nr:hypothetical protein [Elusimicrobiota bacterium]